MNEQELLINLIGDIRNRVLETRSIIKFVGRGKYTDVQGLIMVDKEMVKIDDILRKYEKELMNPNINEIGIWHNSI